MNGLYLCRIKKGENVMIDFNKSVVFKLKPMEITDVREEVKAFLVDGENILSSFKTVRDQLVFTNKRVIATNVQGFTGKKVDYTSIPYSKVQTFSVETSGMLDLDCEIELYISAIGKVKFEIKGNFDIVEFNKILSDYVLK